MVKQAKEREKINHKKRQDAPKAGTEFHFQTIPRRRRHQGLVQEEVDIIRQNTKQP